MIPGLCSGSQATLTLTDQNGGHVIFADLQQHLLTYDRGFGRNELCLGLSKAAEILSLGRVEDWINL